MRSRVESEDNARRLKLLHEAKRKAVGWLQELKQASKRSSKAKNKLASQEG